MAARSPYPTEQGKLDVERLNVQLCSLVFRIYGDKDKRTLRAEEIAASIKRFEWAVERAGESGEAANASV